MDGTIWSLVAERGFGIIETTEGEQFFFHRGALKGIDFEDLAAGTHVVFEAGHDSGDHPGERPRAVNVRLADDAVPAPDHELLGPSKTGQVP